MAALAVTVWPRQTAGNPYNKSLSAILERDPAHAYPGNRRLEPTANAIFEPRLQLLRVGNVEANEVGRDAVPLVHADDQVAPAGIQEGGDVIKEFFVSVTRLQP